MVVVVVVVQGKMVQPTDNARIRLWARYSAVLHTSLGTKLTNDLNKVPTR
jgi:hypothetical protein